MDIIPNFWSWKLPVTAKRAVAVFIPYAGPKQYRQFGDGSEQHEWELGNDDSQYENFLIIKSFWASHYPGVTFYLYDPVLDETRTYQIESDLSFEYNHADSFSWNFKISEVYPYIRIIGSPSGSQQYGEEEYGG